MAGLVHRYCSILLIQEHFSGTGKPPPGKPPPGGLPGGALFWYALESRVRMKSKEPNPSFDPKAFLAGANGGKKLVKYRTGGRIFAQGEPADSLFYIHDGKVKLSVVSRQGREAVIALLDAGEFFGEGCLAGQSLRMATATALTASSITRLDKVAMIRVLREQPSFSEMFVTHLLSRNIKFEGDLVDQLFNSSEKRLARVLLLLANFGKPGQPEAVIPKISQETLAEIVGTTRSRVSFFMNRFRKLGFVDYSRGTLEVHSSLLTIVLND
jgi:CRP/FNR family cyclic AMP-dependent transcriptional regulator